MSDRPERKLTSLNPLHDALVLEFARRELDDDKLAETLARWTR